MDWNTKHRPKTPQRGAFKTSSPDGAPAKGRKRKGSSAAAPSEGVSATFCERQGSGWSVKSRSRKGAPAAVCSATPLAKARPTPPTPSSVTSSNFYAPQSGKNKGKIQGVCPPNKPGACSAQVGYRAGRRVLRFCTSPGKLGHVVDIHGMAPGEVYKLTSEACASWRKKGSYAGTPVGAAALGGLRKRKARPGRKARKARR